jgi:protein-S-isoprenylcysteine O-methyltransferase Ste14
MGRIVALVDGNFIGIFLKERGLVQAFGQRYRQHRRGVRMLLPQPNRSAETQSTKVAH